jgi:alkylated DNA repair dioxygenase AlkB
MDAARYGISITLVDDCLGYRKKDRHDMAIKQLKEFMEAEAMGRHAVLERLRNPPDGSEYSYEEASEAEDEYEQVPIASTAKPGEMTALEADSDDSDEEVQLPILSRAHDRRLELRFPRTAGSHSQLASGESREPVPEPAHPSGSYQTSSRNRVFTKSVNGQGDEKSETEPDSAVRTGRLRGHESRGHKSQPWLDIIPTTNTAAQRSSVRTTTSTGTTDHRGLIALSTATEVSPSTVPGYDKMRRAESGREEDGQSTPVDAATNGKALFGEDLEEESTGSRIQYDLLPDQVNGAIFEELRKEVNWQTMYHQTGEVPRLVCCQGTVESDGSMPVYRHPSDQSIPLQPWTTNVDLIRKAAERVVGHTLNHVLIQLYRGGNDFISEHSDKTLDVAPGSKIVNVSFGAQRTMRLRTKRDALGSGAPPRTTHRIPMPHNSILTMSLETNAKYLHGINADKRPRCELVPAETAYEGQRISLTFRHIATFISRDSGLIWGQGATGKSFETARPVINGDAKESERLVRAFAAENRASTINWEGTYGDGSDVLHLKGGD